MPIYTSLVGNNQVHCVSMASILSGLIYYVLMIGALSKGLYGSPDFYDNYAIIWGQDHVSVLDQGRTVQLSLDKSSGSGFASKSYYGSGFFHMDMKVPGGDSSGVVTTFYLTQAKDQGNDEVDFEFLGNKEGNLYILQTNVFVNGQGKREQRIRLWFDPTSNSHSYRILWNSYQIAFFVDNYPIRVFQNKTNIGAEYPSHPMKVIGTIWNGEGWATDGGRAKINWTYAPFKAQYQGFDVDGCPSGNFQAGPCSSPVLWWNTAQYQTLNATEESLYEYVRENYMTYDYCSDRSRYPIPPLECPP